MSEGISYHIAGKLLWGDKPPSVVYNLGLAGCQDWIGLGKITLWGRWFDPLL